MCNLVLKDKYNWDSGFLPLIKSPKPGPFKATETGNVNMKEAKQTEFQLSPLNQLTSPTVQGQL